MMRLLPAILVLLPQLGWAAPKIERTALYLLAKPSVDGYRKVRDALEAQDGVQMVSGKPGMTRLVVTHESRVKPDRLLQAITRAGHRASLTAPESSPWPAPADWRGADMKVISKNGKTVTLDKHLAKRKVTIVDFTAEWCKPCALLDQKLAELARANKRVAVRKIDVTEWDTPVVRQFLGGVRGLPYVEVFDPQGRRVRTLQIPEIWRIGQIVEEYL